MELGMIGLGRMGANMVRRLIRAGHQCVVFDRSPGAVELAVKEGARGAGSLDEFVGRLEMPRTVCLMIPAAAVEGIVDALVPRMIPGDTIVDGGNSHYQDDIRRAKRLASLGLHYVDMGTSGGIWGLERGYCLTIGGEPDIVKRLDPFFAALAPGAGAAPPTPGRLHQTAAEHGYLHCGAAGAGHFVTMVHNGIEYGLMAAYAEGLNILRHANVGNTAPGSDIEPAPRIVAEHYSYDFDLTAITEVWRRGSVIASWLLDLMAAALVKDPSLESFSGHVADSGEGRWTLQAAADEGVPAHVLAAALFERFASRGRDQFQNRVLSAMRFGFGGHVER